MSSMEVWQGVHICSLLQDWQWCLQFLNAWKIVLWFSFSSPRQLNTELLSIRLELFTLLIVKNGITWKKALFVTSFDGTSCYVYNQWTTVHSYTHSWFIIEKNVHTASLSTCMRHMCMHTTYTDVNTQNIFVLLLASSDSQSYVMYVFVFSPVKRISLPSSIFWILDLLKMCPNPIIYSFFRFTSN